jgi:hypothetical protein
MEAPHFGFVIFMSIVVAIWWKLSTPAERMHKMIITILVFVAGLIRFSYSNDDKGVGILVIVVITITFVCSATSKVLDRENIQAVT